MVERLDLEPPSQCDVSSHGLRLSTVHGRYVIMSGHETQSFIFRSVGNGLLLGEPLGVLGPKRRGGGILRGVALNHHDRSMSKGAWSEPVGGPTWNRVMVRFVLVRQWSSGILRGRILAGHVGCRPTRCRVN